MWYLIFTNGVYFILDRQEYMENRHHMGEYTFLGGFDTWDEAAEKKARLRGV